MSITIEDKSSTHELLGMEVGWCIGVCYEDYGMTVSRNQEWLQGTIDVIIVLFRRVGLMANIEKPNTMTYQPGAIRMGMSDEDFSLRSKLKSVSDIPMRIYPGW